MNIGICVFGISALLTLDASRVLQIGSGGEAAVSNCVGSNCDKVIAGFEEDLEKKQLEVEEKELSGERTQPNLDSVGSLSGLKENPSRFHDLLQQIVGKLNELSLQLSSSSSSLPTFPTGTKFYTSDGRGGLSAISAPVISLPVEEATFENNLAKKTQGIRCLKLLDSLVGEAPFEDNIDVKTEGIGCFKLLDSLTGQERREITKLLLKKILL